MKMLVTFLFSFGLSANAFIIDGRDARPSEYPAVIDFEVFIGSRLESLCTGTFVSNNTILTAAHCVYKYLRAEEEGKTAEIILPTDQPYHVLISESYRRFKKQEEQGYQGTEYLRISSDLALIVMEDHVKTPAMGFDEKPVVGPATIVGFGGKQLMTREELNKATDPTLGIKRIGKVEIAKIHSAGRMETVPEVYEAEHWYNWGDYLDSFSDHLSLSSRGDSGGPVIQNGKVVGVISGTDSSHQDESTVFSSKNYFAGLHSGDFTELKQAAKKYGSTIR